MPIQIFNYENGLTYSFFFLVTTDVIEMKHYSDEIVFSFFDDKTVKKATHSKTNCEGEIL